MWIFYVPIYLLAWIRLLLTVSSLYWTSFTNFLIIISNIFIINVEKLNIVHIKQLIFKVQHALNGLKRYIKLQTIFPFIRKMIWGKEKRLGITIIKLYEVIQSNHWLFNIFSKIKNNKILFPESKNINLILKRIQKSY